MFEKIIQFSLSNKLLIGLGTIALAVAGIYYGTQIPLDAVPDITNNQVQIVSTAPTFAPQEVEQLITFPLEAAMTIKCTSVLQRATGYSKGWAPKWGRT